MQSLNSTSYDVDNYTKFLQNHHWNIPIIKFTYFKGWNSSVCKQPWFVFIAMISQTRAEKINVKNYRDNNYISIQINNPFIGDLKLQHCNARYQLQCMWQKAHLICKKDGLTSHYWLDFNLWQQFWHQISVLPEIKHYKCWT